MHPAEPSGDHRTVAVLLAGGAGSRFGAAVSKVYVHLAGIPVLAHSLRTLDTSSDIDDVVVVRRPEDADRYDAIAADEPTSKIRAVVAGGATRQASEWAGIRAVAAHVPDAHLVLLHDAARPLLTAGLVHRLVRACAGGGGALPALHPVDDLVSHDGRPLGAADVVAVQTPQVFPLDLLLDVYPRAIAARFDGVDTAQTVQAHADVVVRWVASGAENMKLTHAADLRTAEGLLAARGRPRAHAHPTATLPPDPPPLHHRL